MESLLTALKSGAISLGAALMWRVVPFIVPDLVKMVLAIFLFNKSRKVLHL